MKKLLFGICSLFIMGIASAFDFPWIFETDDTEQVKSQGELYDELENSISTSGFQFEMNYPDCSFEANLTNNSGKDIKAVQFFVQFQDELGNIIGQKDFSYKGVIRSWESVTASWRIYSFFKAAQGFENIRYGQSMEGKIVSLVKNNEVVRVVMKNKAISYTDGTLIRDNSFF